MIAVAIAFLVFAGAYAGIVLGLGLIKDSLAHKSEIQSMRIIGAVVGGVFLLVGILLLAFGGMLICA